MRRSLTLLCLCLGALVLCPGCVLRALAFGGPQANLSARSASTDEGPPIYDCRRNWLHSGSTCVPRSVPTPRRAPVLAPADSQDSYSSRDGTLMTRCNIAGGGITMRARVATHPTRALLSVRSAQELAPGPCSVRVFRDGEALTVHERARASDHQLLLVIDVIDLRQLHDSTRFTIEGCGRSFVLDAAARTTLSQFEARFREERKKLDDSSLADARAP